MCNTQLHIQIHIVYLGPPTSKILTPQHSRPSNYGDSDTSLQREVATIIIIIIILLFATSMHHQPFLVFWQIEKIQHSRRAPVSGAAGQQHTSPRPHPCPVHSITFCRTQFYCSTIINFHLLLMYLKFLQIGISTLILFPKHTNVCSFEGC